MKKKPFAFLLLAVLLLMAVQPGFAEAPACPVSAPPAMGQYTTHWQLSPGQPPAYRITLAVDEETGLRTYTLHDPAVWGIAPDAMGTWRYVPETAAAEEPAEAAEGDMLPTPVPSGWLQTAQGGEGITLELTDADYAELGFPAWKAPCAAGADALILNVYLGQVRQLYAYVDYLFGDDSISITAEDHSFIISLLEPEGEGYTTSYASYDSNGILAYASYAREAADGSFTAWRVEAVPAHEEYRLTTITHVDAEGSTCYWENGEWQNTEFVKVDAPEGISPEDVPYTITGDWLGIPFAQPGDAPKGSFPAGEHAADAALLPADYLPWPAGEEALYRSWAEGKAVPALPAAGWETLEDGTLAYTLTGVEGLGLQEAHQCDWRWSDAAGSWQPEGEPTPGQIRFLAPAEVTDVYWEQPGQNPDLMVMIALNRRNMRQELGLTSLQDGWWWQMDNQGGLFLSRPLDESRTLTAEYDRYQLLQYDILTIDEAGNPVSQTTFDAPDGSPDTLTLHLYYHYSEDAAQEALWLRDIGWYSYETGKPCDAPEGVNPESCQPLPVR